MIQCVTEPDVLEVKRGREEIGGSFRAEISQAEKLTELTVIFSLGSEEEDLVLMERAAKIRGKISYGWHLRKRIKRDEQCLTWLAERTHTQELPFCEDMWIEFSDIFPEVTGVAYMEIWSQGRKLMQLPVQKKEGETAILYFEPRPGTVKKGGKAVLFWETSGAEECILHPGGRRVPSTGSCEVIPGEDAEYLLEAVRDGKKVSAAAHVYLYDESLTTYYFAKPAAYYKGSVSRLFWKNAAAEGKRLKVTKVTPEFGVYDKNSTEGLPAGTGKRVTFELMDEAAKAAGTEGLPAVTGKAVTFEFLDEAGKAVSTGILEMKPDRREAILDYMVYIEPKDPKDPKEPKIPYTYFVSWDTVKGLECRLSVMVFEPKGNAWKKKKQIFLAKEQSGGLLSYKEEDGEKCAGLKYYFILQVRNEEEQWKHAVYMFSGGKETGYYDNLRREEENPY